MLSHLSLGTRDLLQAGRFYDAALGALGYARVWTADTAIGYGVEGGGDKLAIKERSAEDARLAAGPGFHLAFVAPTQPEALRCRALRVSDGPLGKLEDGRHALVAGRDDLLRRQYEASPAAPRRPELDDEG